MKAIPVLLYHGVNDSPSSRLADFTITPETFSSHLDILERGGFTTIRVTQLVDHLRAGTFESTYADTRVALVTFDDGWADFFDNALPAMLARDVASTLYVTTGFVSGDVPLPQERVASWAQIADADAAGVEIGAHSHTHPQMDTLLRGRAWEELSRSKSMLEDAIGKAVPSFAYPHGYNSPGLREQCRSAGFTSGVGVRNMLSHPGDDLYAISRLTVTSSTSLDDVEGWLYGEGARVAGNGESMKTRGWRAFRLTRALVTNTPGNEYA